MKKMRLVGMVSDKGYQKAKFALEVLAQRNADNFSPPVIEGLMEFQWNIFVDEMKRLHRGVVWNKAVVFDDNDIRNSDQFLQWATDNFAYQDTR